MEGPKKFSESYLESNGIDAEEAKRSTDILQKWISITGILLPFGIKKEI